MCFKVPEVPKKAVPEKKLPEPAAPPAKGTCQHYCNSHMEGFFLIPMIYIVDCAVLGFNCKAPHSLMSSSEDFQPIYLIY